MTYPNNPYPQQQPGYGYPPAGAPQQPAYGAPQPGYGAPQPAYGTPQPGYEAVPPGYGAPQPGYDAASPAYGAPQPGYDAKPGYDQAQPAYGAPQPAYGVPQSPYGAPQPAYGVPQPGYAPFGGYGAQYASWGARVGAYIVDMLIICVPGWILEIIASTAGTSKATCTTSPSSYHTTCSGGGYNALGVIFALLAFVAFVGIALYLAYLEGRTGQTPGKKVLNIRLVREDTGRPVGMGLAIGRRLLHFIDGLPCYLGYLWPLWDEKKQTFADKIASTIVVKV